MVLIIVPAEVPSKCEVPGWARARGGGMVMGDGAGACMVLLRTYTADVR